MNDFLVTFWGTRGSIATPGRSTEKYGGNTSSVSVRFGDTYFIFDAGTGIRPLGVEIMRDCKPETGKFELHLFLSHTHWDHIQGLPFFQPAYHPSFALKIYGTARKDQMLENLLVGQMDSSYFPVPMSALSSDLVVNDLNNAKNLKAGEVDIDFQELDHPGGSLSFRLKCRGKTIVYATDNELNNQFDECGKLKDGNELGRQYLEFINGADLLIADGQYTEEEYKTKQGWGHTSVPVLLKVAKQAGVKQVAVYHHDPMHTDNFLDELSADFLKQTQDNDPHMDIFWAREGLTLAI
jgi:phosphoribosyl 1,2-cyclic phosphodiesterase